MSQRLIALILGTVLLSGCTGFALRGNSVLNTQPTGGPALPFPTDRVVSGTNEYVHTGVETDARSPGAIDADPELMLNSAPGGVEWATYVFVPSGAYPLGNATVTLGVPGSFGVWMAVANFAESHWEFSGPFTGVAAMPLSADNISPLGNVYVAVVVGDSSIAKVDEVKISETTPDQPVASLTTQTPKVDPGETVDLDASASSSPNGAITDYEWDLDGNGTFNEPGAEQTARGSAAASITFGSQPSAVDVAVRITDSLGLQATATLTVTAVGWVIVQVDSTHGSGDVVSLAAIDGKPAIAFDMPPSALGYAYSTTPDGTSGWSILAVDPGGSVGRCSLAEVNGHPGIAFQQSLPHDLWYALSSSADGSSGWSSLALNQAGEVQANCELEVIAGRPAVVSYSTTSGSNGELEYYYANGPGGDTGWNMTVVDSGNTCGINCTLANFAETPALVYSYFQLGIYYTNYATNPNADGSGSWDLQQVSGDSGLPSCFNLVRLSNGNPVLSFKGLNDELWLARCTAPVGGSWSKAALLAADTGNANAMALINGRPAICTQYSDQSLYFGQPDTDDASGSWNFAAVETQTVNATNTSMAEIDGRPGIAFHPSSGGLYYATLFE